MDMTDPFFTEPVAPDKNLGTTSTGLEFPKEPTFDSSKGMLEFPSNKTVLMSDIEDVKAKSQNYDLALGALSPGVDQIQQALLTDKEAFKTQKTQEYDNDFNLKRDQVILNYLRTRDQGKPFNEKELASLRTMTQNDLNDPDTFLERMYAKGVADWERAKPAIMLAAKESGNIAKVQEDLEEKQNRVTNLIAHKEIARTLAEDLKVKLKNQGYIPHGLHMVYDMVPVVNQINSRNNFSEQPELFSGGNIEAQVAHYYSLPIKEAKKKLEEMIATMTAPDALGNQNFYRTHNIVEKFIEYGSSDAALDSFMNVVDVGLTNTAQKTVKAVSRGLLASTSKAEVNMATRAMALGDQDTAVRIAALDMIRAKAGQGSGNIEDLITMSPALFNNKFYDSAMQSIPHQAARLEAEAWAKGQTDKALEALSADPRRITRLEQDAQQLANANTVGSFYKRYPSSSDGIIDVVHISNLDQATNVNTLEIILGNTRKKLFADPKVAEKYAKEQYGLSSFEVKQSPTSPYYYISTKVDTAESANNLIRLNVPTQKKNSVAETVFGWLSGADRNRSKDLNTASRQLLYGTDQIIDKVQALGEPLKAVRKDNDFSNFLLHNHINEVTHQTASEMENAWVKQFGKLPSEAQVKAYDAAVRIDELARFQENMITRSALIQKGVENHTIKVGKDNQELLGKFIPEGLPTPKTSSYRIGFHYSGDNTITAISSASPDIKDIKALTDTGGYKVIQLTPDAKKKLVDAGEEFVDYIVVKDLKTGPVPFDLVKKKQGWNQTLDPETIFIGQPNVSQSRGAGGVSEQFYHGNSTLFHSTDPKTAKEIETNLEKARKLFLAGDKQATKEFVERSLPPGLDSVEEFEKLFTVGGYNPRIPFYSRKQGEDAAGKMRSWKTEDGQNSLFPNLQDSVVSEHNLYQGSPVSGYSKELEDLGKGIMREGTDSNPLFKVTQEQVLSPMAALEKSVEDLSRSILLEDFKIKSARDFIEKFHSILNHSIDEMRADPLKFMLNPTWVEGADKGLKAQALNSLKAHINLLGVDSPAVFSLRKAISDVVVDKFGDEATLMGRSAIAISKTSPVNAAKNFAFHMTQGLGAVGTMVAQGMNVINIVAIHPKNGLQGASAALFRNMGRVAGDDLAIRAAEKMLVAEGWRKGEYREALEAYLKSGFDKVSRYTMTDAATSPVMRQGKVGDAVDKLLDLGTMPLKAGEAFNRDAAWFTAYKEWRDANPTKVFNTKEQANVLLKADVLSGNMSRASRAQWDSGTLGVVTHFKSWYGRQFDMLVGDQLTTAQKTRLIFANTAAFGAVSGGAVGLVGGTVWPTGQSMRKYLNENGHSTDDAKVNAVVNGLISAGISGILGDQYAFSEKFGAGQNDMFKHLWDGKFVKALGGPSGSLIIKAFEGNVVSESLKLTKDLVDGKPRDVNLLRQEIMNLGRNIRSVNDVTNLYTGLTLQKLMTKGGITADVTTQEVLVKFFSGMTTSRLQDIYDKGESLEENKRFKLGLEKQIRSDLNNMYRFALTDKSLADQYQTRVYFNLEVGRFSPSERTKLLSDREVDSVLGINRRFRDTFPKSKKIVDKSILSYEKIKEGNK